MVGGTAVASSALNGRSNAPRKRGCSRLASMSVLDCVQCPSTGPRTRPRQMAPTSACSSRSRTNSQSWHSAYGDGTRSGGSWSLTFGFAPSYGHDLATPLSADDRLNPPSPVWDFPKSFPTARKVPANRPKSTSSTSWGSLVRAQYRPPHKSPAKAGLFVCCTWGRRGANVPRGCRLAARDPCPAAPSSTTDGERCGRLKPSTCLLPRP